MDKFTIKDIETLSGIKAHTIRIWEQRYCFLKPCRTPGNIRNYSCEELKTILNIAFLNRHGYKISHIEKMKAEEINEKVLNIAGKATATENIVNDLLQQMIDLNMDGFEEILNEQFEEKGTDSTVMDIIFPFLEKTGILHHSHFNNSREHLVAPILRQKLSVAIDNVTSSSNTGKTAILFLPAATQQELGLLSLYYLLRKNGIEAIYLGADVSCQDVGHVATIKAVDLIFTQSTYSDRAKFINELRKYFTRHTTVIFSDPKQVPVRKLPVNIHSNSSLSEVNNFLSSL
jgi:DNA-binding transcriptional MerR regulator